MATKTSEVTDPEQLRVIMRTYWLSRWALERALPNWIGGDNQPDALWEISMRHLARVFYDNALKEPT